MLALSITVQWGFAGIPEVDLEALHCSYSILSLYVISNVMASDNDNTIITVLGLVLVITAVILVVFWVIHGCFSSQ